MKKIVYVLPVLLLLAAGCNSSLTVQNSGSNQSPLIADSSTSSTPQTQTKQNTNGSDYVPSTNSGTVTYTNKDWGFSMDISKDFIYKESKLSNNSGIVLTVTDPKDKSLGHELTVFIQKNPIDANGRIYTDLLAYTKSLEKSTPPDVVINSVTLTTFGQYPEGSMVYTNNEMGIRQARINTLMKDGVFYAIEFAPSESMDFEGLAGTFKFLNK
ncbi:MAG: hypothetical protein JWO40_797 [Candidatus Doudnabacteria bacterium]|nr:hypothetical protein [Candidatus Doudnabacteria bacterium]